MLIAFWISFSIIKKKKKKGKKNPKPTTVDIGNKVVTYKVYKHNFASKPFGSLLLLSFYITIFS